MESQACIVKSYTNFATKKRCLNCKLTIAGNSKRLFILTEHLIFVSILRICLKKWEKLKLHIDKLPYVVDLNKGGILMFKGTSVTFELQRNFKDFEN